ncbi:hypothetical protein QVD17_09515 [Tagetes erecta]|uniref:HTH La-type RNA-binding domain-containing protein n=1 Tax=Tagetes erecta TaxID=13708 RepID=A0AAD8P5C9_TARER|nr:hypothetical protein QVD17_09515 [Tagetes erecta]
MAATTFQSDDSGDVKNPSSPGQSPSVSLPWSSIVKDPAAAVSSAPVSVVPSPTFSSPVEEKTSSLPEILVVSDDSGTEAQGTDTGSGGSNVSKKTVWNKPSNGVVEVVNPVMGAVSWPALGDFSKSSPKSLSSESLKALADGPSPPAALQSVTENSSSSPRKHKTANNTSPSSTQNNVPPAKQRYTKRGGGSFNLNVSANGGVSHISATSQDSVESSPRENPRVESLKGGFGSQTQNGNDRQHQRNTYRRSNSGPHSRGDGSYHHGYGGKRDQDREWNQHSKSFNGRDSHAHSPRGYPRGYVRPTVHTPPQFMPPQMPLLRPFGNNMMYPDMSSPLFYFQGPPPPPESLRAMPPLVGPIPPPMYFVSNPMLHAMIVNQIDFYFSNDNLVKDIYLRKNMDEQGWVPVSLIAGFKKVLNLTDNIQLILDAMRASTIVEVQGDKIRRRNDWMRWLMQPPAQAVGNQDALASQLQGVALDDATPTLEDSVQTSFGSRGSSSQSLQGGGHVVDEKLII